jgi:hypothetical protein
VFYKSIDTVIQGLRLKHIEDKEEALDLSPIVGVDSY